MVTADATISKWGNGRGILLPKSMCDRMGVDIGEKVSLTFDPASNSVRIQPKQSWTLQSLMAGYNGPTPGEIDADEASVGGELW